MMSVLLLALAHATMGQQYMWTTVDSDSNVYERQITMSTVLSEVLAYYDQYDYYFDLTGYSKQNFIDKVKWGYFDSTWLNGMDSLSIFAIKSNSGRSSVITVLCVSDRNVDMVLFSNDSVVRPHPQSTLNSREKFKSWFKLILN